MLTSGRGGDGTRLTAIVLLEECRLEVTLAVCPAGQSLTTGNLARAILTCDNPPRGNDMVSTVASFVETRFRKRRKSGNPHRRKRRRRWCHFFFESFTDSCFNCGLFLRSVLLEVCDVQQIVLVFQFFVRLCLANLARHRVVTDVTSAYQLRAQLVFFFLFLSKIARRPQNFRRWF